MTERFNYDRMLGERMRAVEAQITAALPAVAAVAGAHQPMTVDALREAGAACAHLGPVAIRLGVELLTRAEDLAVRRRNDAAEMNFLTVSNPHDIGESTGDE